MVIPAYNEERRLPGTLNALTSYLDERGESYEIIVADDGSTDSTVALARSIAVWSPGVRVLALAHRGKGHAVRRGMLVASGTRIVFCDADLPVAATDIGRLADRLESCEVAIGSREGPGARRIDEPYYRHLMGRVFNRVVSILAIPGLQDTQCGLKAFAADAAREIFTRQAIDGFGFDVEVLFVAARLGYRIDQVPVVWQHRPSSRVEPIWDTLRMLRDVLWVRAHAARGRYGVTPEVANRSGHKVRSSTTPQEER